MIRSTIAITITIALGCLVISCGPKGPTDQAIATDLQAKLYANDAVRSANVKVTVNNGVVTLSGDVPSSDIELQAMKIANATAGVKSVTDQMKVNAALATAATPPPNPEPAPATSTPPAPATSAAPPPDAAMEKKAERRKERKREEEKSERVADAPPSTPAPPQPVSYTVPAGSTISVRMIDGIDSKTNTAGQTFRASLDAPLTVEGATVAPAGSPATVLLANARGAGRISGSSNLEVRITSIEVGGQRYQVNTSVYAEQGKSRGKQTAIRSGIGAAAGAVIGAIAGGGKGAAIGAAAGGGAGAGYQLATHGPQVKIASEQQLSFRLEAPLTVTVNP